MALKEMEERLQARYFADPRHSQTEQDLARLLIPKFRQFISATPFLNHTEVCVNLPLDDLLHVVAEDGFKDLLLDKPEVVIPSIAYSLHRIALDDASDPTKVERCKCLVRISVAQPTHTIKELKASSIGKFIAIKGTVIRASSIRPHLVSMDFQCAGCSAVLESNFHDGRFVPPTRCPRCKHKTFTPLRETVFVTERQRIRIQEIDEGEGRIPRSIECELVHDLVNLCVPGDSVVVCGVLRREEVVVPRKSYDQTIYEPYISVLSLENCRVESADRNITDFTETDMKLIDCIRGQQHVFRLLVHSLCPPIFGHYIVKAAIVLILFGGSRRLDAAAIRSDSHLLLVGDPGLGKSQMLKAVANVIPRGVYVSGSSSTKTGLTVALHRSAGSSDFMLESGALVLGDQGVCCIDEFDKMERAEHSSLLEAMEQQSISIAKAGIVCTLPARTSVIAAANPVEGHFNRGRTVAENIHMPAPLLSRFDLIFVLVDNPDEATDRELSSHIIAMHSTTKQPRQRKRHFAINRQPSGEQQTLREYLADHSSESSDPLPPRLFRKYIAFARANVHPVLSPDAKDAIQRFYIELRQSYKEDDDTPVTTRQLESLIRLTEARAKVECREEATAADARDVIEIFKIASMTGLGGSSNVPVLDFRGMGTVRGGKAKLLKSLVTYLQNEAKRKASVLFSKTELRDIGIKLGVPDMDNLVQQLNNEGFLLQQFGGYKLSTGM